jgi:hypothetical protein
MLQGRDPAQVQQFLKWSAALANNPRDGYAETWQIHKAPSAPNVGRWALAPPFGIPPEQPRERTPASSVHNLVPSRWTAYG